MYKVNIAQYRCNAGALQFFIPSGRLFLIEWYYRKAAVSLLSATSIHTCPAGIRPRPTVTTLCLTTHANSFCNFSTRLVCEWWSHNSDINEFTDGLPSDRLDSIRRAIYSFCWRDLFWRRSGGLHRVRQMRQTNTSASSSHADHLPETETNIWVSSKKL